jgi:putative membrane protein
MEEIKHVLKARLFFRVTRAVALFAIYSALVVHLEIVVLNREYEVSPIVLTAFGVALSLLMVFRTNSTYDRWWEGRKLWGVIIAAAQSLTMQVHGWSWVEASRRAEICQLIPRVAASLTEQLRGGWPPPSLGPSLVVQDLLHKINALWSEGLIHSLQYQVAESNLLAFIQGICGCGRIRGTLLPLSHRAVIPQVLLGYLLVLPFGLPNEYYSIVVSLTVGYFLVALEFIAKELEEPFGRELDDLDLDALTAGIEGAVRQLTAVIPPPLTRPTKD